MFEWWEDAEEKIDGYVTMFILVCIKFPLQILITYYNQFNSLNYMSICFTCYYQNKNYYCTINDIYEPFLPKFEMIEVTEKCNANLRKTEDLTV